MAQDLADLGRVDPLLDPAPRLLVVQVARDRAEGDAAATEDVGDLRQRALPTVGQPLAGVEGGMVHVLGGLHVDDQHRGLGPLRDGQHHVRREVRRQVDDDHVAVRRSQGLGCCRSLEWVADEADVHDLAVHPVQTIRNEPGRCLEVVQQPRELRPVGAQATGHETDAGSPA